MAQLSLSEDDIEAIALRFFELLEDKFEHIDSTPAGWLDSRAAAEYACASVQAIQLACAERSLRFAQNAERGRLYFKPEWLDDWREGRAPDWSD